MSERPTGTVTLLFTDVEGSTMLLRRLGDYYGDVLAAHRRLLRDVFASSHGHEIDTQGDSFFVAFGRARDALVAAADAQARLSKEEWPHGAELRVRMGVHTGEPALGDEGYLGLDVHRAARICAAAHGGQIVISQTTRELTHDVLPAEMQVEDLGEHRLKDLPRREHLFQLVVPGLRSTFPPLKDLDSQAAAASPFLGRERELGVKARHAVSAATGRVMGTFARRAPARHRGFADFGWDVRAMLPAAPAELQGPLAELGGDLFMLGRTAADCERYLGSVDRKLIEARLRENREMAVLSRRSATEAAAIEERLRQFDALAKRHASLDEIATEVEATVKRLRRSTSENVAAARADVEGLRLLIHEADGLLDAELRTVRDALGDVGIALKRTRHRGVFRVGSRYVVPFFDDAGIDQRREFSSPDEAMAFVRSVRLVDSGREEEWVEGTVAGVRQWGAEQGVIPPRRGRR